MSEFPSEISAILELAKPPTIEEELEMEKAIRVALSITDIDELKRHVEALLRQNHQQSIFISHSLDKIHYLHAKIACIENRVEQPKKEGLSQFFSTFFYPKS
mgnify:CR=1 FL=1